MTGSACKCRRNARLCLGPDFGIDEARRALTSLQKFDDLIGRQLCVVAPGFVRDACGVEGGNYVRELEQRVLWRWWFLIPDIQTRTRKVTALQCFG